MFPIHHVTQEKSQLITRVLRAAGWNGKCCEKWLSYFLVTLDWNGMNFLAAWNWNVADGMEWRNAMSGMARNGMPERIPEAGNVVYID